MNKTPLALLCVVTIGSISQAQGRKALKNPAAPHVHVLVLKVTEFIRTRHDELSEHDFRELPAKTLAWLRASAIRYDHLFRPDVSKVEISKPEKQMWIPYYHPVYYSLQLGELKLKKQISDAREQLKKIPPDMRKRLEAKKKREVGSLEMRLDLNRLMQEAYRSAHPLRGRGPHLIKKKGRQR